MKKLFLFVSLTFSTIAGASISDCQNIHIGRIWVEKGTGLNGVVFLNNRGDPNGSWWVHFTGWSVDERKEALSMLLAAKAANHRVNVVTEETNNCGIESGYTVAKSIYLTTNP